ncbi:KilA-N domain-containing protein [Pseudomonas veronii]|uniref:KilA-N domain-containing protein n=1 Tax=Pseudomonas veronii TaxID=76761 RepID=UPI0015A015BD|nr:KilA-N domain-containing protein [Pseudomonas veronii]NWC59523.1 KilA-N domain-containing protein [Pseudomonas veronii]
MNAVVTKAGNVVERQYQGMSFKFREDGYFNMTHAAKQFGKQLQHFWGASGTEEYKEALAYAISNTSESDEFNTEIVETQVGGHFYVYYKGVTKCLKQFKPYKP